LYQKTSPTSSQLRREMALLALAVEDGYASVAFMFLLPVAAQRAQRQSGFDLCATLAHISAHGSDNDNPPAAEAGAVGGPRDG
jgi:hypothetical protein